jgi:hypothetical protein
MPPIVTVQPWRLCRSKTSSRSPSRTRSSPATQPICSQCSASRPVSAALPARSVIPARRPGDLASMVAAPSANRSIANHAIIAPTGSGRCGPRVSTISWDGWPSLGLGGSPPVAARQASANTTAVPVTSSALFRTGSSTANVVAPFSTQAPTMIVSQQPRLGGAAEMPSPIFIIAMFSTTGGSPCDSFITWGMRSLNAWSSVMAARTIASTRWRKSSLMMITLAQPGVAERLPRIRF